MQRVSALLPSWDSNSKAATTNPSDTSATTTGAPKQKPSLVSLDKVFGWVGNRTSFSGKRLSSTATTNANPAPEPSSSSKEAYWPTALDRECEKAARILKSFCTDGFLAQEDAGSRPTSASESTDPVSTKYVSKKIPPRIIQDAVGLAIFSCMRSGLWMSGSGGSGILIARKADGTWSPPSGIILHTAALGFTAGVDIYDCVLVINSVAALEVFTKPRITLGHDVDLTVGPLVTTGLLENDIRWKELEGTVLTYLKARGTHQHVPLVGSLVTERSNENERFYGGNVGVLDVLAGNIHKDIPETRPIFEVIKAAEGRTDYDTALMEELAQRPAPGDAILDSPTDKITPLSPPRSPFGVPNADDPDPFGVIALEMAGLEIREAGTRLRPASSQFEFHPAPTSPLFSNFQRQSIDTYLSKSNRSNRGSVMSQKSQGTQTEMTPETTLSRNTSVDGQQEGVVDKLPTVVEPEEIDYTKIDLSALEILRRKSTVATEPVRADVTSPQSKPSTVDHGSETDLEKKSSLYPTTDEEQDDDADEDADDEDDDDDYVSAGEEDDTVVYEIATATAPARAAIMSTQVTQVIQAKGALVTIPKRIPPPLPARSPARTSRASKSDIGDVTPLRSPLRNSFQSEDGRSLRAATPTVEGNVSEQMTEAPVADPHAKEASNTFLEPSTPAAIGHRKQPSSVYPADEKRSSVQITHSPPTPQIGGSTSSGDEQEPEPKTPSASDEAGVQPNGEHVRQPPKDDTGLFLEPVTLTSQ